MNIEKNHQDLFGRRLHELEERFLDLAPEIQDSPEKEAISVLHGMLHELWRHVGTTTVPLHEPGRNIQDIADLYRQAPRMEGPALHEPLPPGTSAPDLALSDADGRLVHLSQYRGTPVLLVFYPLDWSPGCSQQLDLYQSELEMFGQRGVQVLAVSVDSLYSHGAWAAVRGFTFPLLADFNPKGEVARRYNVYREADGFSERALYLIDPDGVIRWSYVSPYLHHVPDIYATFEAIDEALPSQAYNA